MEFRIFQNSFKISAGYEVIALENSNTSSLTKVAKITKKEFKRFKCDLLKIEELRNIFSKAKIDIVIHLAATKGINPTQSLVDFYNNNITSFLNILKVMREFNVKKLIFASSCAVYGHPRVLPVSEEDAMPSPQNIYARTKFFAEEILKDVSSYENFACIILRIFNPIGAHSSGILGEDPNKKQINILTLLAKNVLENCKNLKISPDCVRDFIHVMDVAEAQIKAVEKLKDLKGVKIYNIGSGDGTSLQNLVEIFERGSDAKVSFTSKPCAENEIKEIVADIKLMQNELNFKLTRTIEEMCRDCWNFMTKNL
jgi:UDP-glucose 4-epimerase